MAKLIDRSDKIQLEEAFKYVSVRLQAGQYCLDQLEQFQQILEPKCGFLDGEIISVTGEELIIHYKKKTYTQCLTQFLEKKDRLQRLLVAQRLYFLVDFVDSPVHPFVHPENLFVYGEEVVVAHRGFIKAIVPYATDRYSYFKQYRGLVLSILYPKYNYESLIEGSGALKEPFSKKIQEATTISEIHQLIGEQIIRQKVKYEKESCVVKRKKYQLFKWGMIVLAILTIGLGTTTSIYLLKKLPEQERISTAKSQFIANNYAGVLGTLKANKVEKLSKETKYIVAVSAVHLDHLTDEQKSAILNHLSQKSEDYLLLYWIYIGRGHFAKALDIAQTFDDNQYILHAYTKLYDTTKTNSTMKGEKKQKLLTKYEKEINHYMEILEGENDEEEVT
ncbi:type VII secretion protein EssB [Enterococcus hirae]|nr:type VII secretion protein EssB [Enterococcus hirae]